MTRKTDYPRHNITPSLDASINAEGSCNGMSHPEVSPFRLGHENRGFWFGFCITLLVLCWVEMVWYMDDTKITKTNLHFLINLNRLL